MLGSYENPFISITHSVFVSGGILYGRGTKLDPVNVGQFEYVDENGKPGYQLKWLDGKGTLVSSSSTTGQRVIPEEIKEYASKYNANTCAEVGKVIKVRKSYQNNGNAVHFILTNTHHLYRAGDYSRATGSSEFIENMGFELDREVILPNDIGIKDFVQIPDSDMADNLLILALDGSLWERDAYGDISVLGEGIKFLDIYDVLPTPINSSIVPEGPFAVSTEGQVFNLSENGFDEYWKGSGDVPYNLCPLYEGQEFNLMAISKYGKLTSEWFDDEVTLLLESYNDREYDSDTPKGRKERQKHIFRPVELIPLVGTTINTYLARNLLDEWVYFNLSESPENDDVFVYPIPSLKGFKTLRVCKNSESKLDYLWYSSLKSSKDSAHPPEILEIPTRLFEHDGSETVYVNLDEAIRTGVRFRPTPTFWKKRAITTRSFSELEETDKKQKNAPHERIAGKFPPKNSGSHKQQNFVHFNCCLCRSPVTLVHGRLYTCSENCFTALKAFYPKQFAKLYPEF